jgi:hypothetical protein
MITTSLLLSVLLAGSKATPLIRKNQANIQWGPCDPSLAASIPYSVPPGWDNTTYDCANYTVPLDYTEQSSAGLILELLRLPARKQPNNGSILLNFGGPGENGRATLLSEAVQLQSMSGYNHDLIAFDPRGTVNTMPVVCLNASEQAIVAIEFPTYSNVSDTAVGEVWASNTIYDAVCDERIGNISTLVGTAFVARDLMAVVDALNEDGLLRYWGMHGHASIH